MCQGTRFSRQIPLPLDQEGEIRTHRRCESNELFPPLSIETNSVTGTQQIRQIGNAVPWPLGEALGRELRKARFKWEQERRAEAIVID